MNWQWQKFVHLSLEQLYEVLQLRQRVFILEQKCFYLDCDGEDPKAWHLLGYKKEKLVAYARVFPPQIKSPEAVIGRVVTAPEERGLGIGKVLVNSVLQKISESFGPCSVSMSAQSYLTGFYQEFGFKSLGEEYLEDGIPHKKMVKNASNV